ncbi:MAG: HRDC domain-containing protein [Phycisphaerales bacterium]|jgi:ribonuclease D|nr:HRDC domain-containing protein [Phycisphaerales bacterium]
MGRRTSHRRKHRRRSHRDSHAEGGAPKPILSHRLVPAGDADWIDTPTGLSSLCEHLKESGLFAFDTEFIGEESYHAKTCVLQVATTDRVALVDPLVITDISPLLSLVADPNVVTIVHAGQQDLEPVVRHLQVAPQNIFDTQVAAGFVGYPWPISLTKLIVAALGHDIGGKLTFSEWDARPLTPMQMRYAADDVRYLPAIHVALMERLEELKRVDWAKCEFASLTRAEAFRFDVQAATKRVCRNKSPRKKELQRIQALVTVRDRLAEAANEPPRTIMPDDCILSLARNPLDTTEQLGELRGFPRDIARAHGDDIIDAIATAADLTPVSIRRTSLEESEANWRQELDGAWALFSAWCVGNDLSPGLVTSRPVFTDWYLACRKGQAPKDGPMTNTWRAEIAAAITDMLDRETTLKFSFSAKLRGERDVP